MSIFLATILTFHTVCIIVLLINIFILVRHINDINSYNLKFIVSQLVLNKILHKNLNNDTNSILSSQYTLINEYIDTISYIRKEDINTLLELYEKDKDAVNDIYGPLLNDVLFKHLENIMKTQDDTLFEAVKDAMTIQDEIVTKE